MKIVYLVHQFFPEYQTGTEKFIFNTAMMAQKFGCNVKVITYSSYGNDYYNHESNGILYHEYIYEGIPVLAYKYRRNPPYMNLVLHNPLLREFSRSVLKYEEPDIIHAGHLMRVHEFVRVAREMNIPYLMTITDFFSICPKINLTPNEFTLCSGPENGKACSKLCPEYDQIFIVDRLSDAKEILFHAKEVISPSHFVKQVFKNEFPKLSIKVNPHGIRYSHITKNKREYKKGDEITFGFIGNLIYHKGVHILLEAFNQINYGDSRLKIFGFGQSKFVEKLKELAGKNMGVTFEGAFESKQLGEIFEQIDVLITPSICYETYSFVLHEALASNVPVIGSNLGVFKEKIIDGYNGYTFETGNSDDLRDKISHLLNNRDLINTLKKNIDSDIVVPKIEQEAFNYYQLYTNKFLKKSENDKNSIDIENESKLFVPPGHYYSPIPDIEEVKAYVNKIKTTNLPKRILGIKLETNIQIELINKFEEFYADIPFQSKKSEGLRYYFNNKSFEYGDATILYSFLRYLKPKRVIEVGSGYSSCVILDTNELFLDNQVKVSFIEPYPELLHKLIRDKDFENNNFYAKKLQETNLEIFAKLEKDDILFIDSTHVSKANSDVNRILFEILPILSKGVVVHFHDIFYPFEYPIQWLLKNQAWNEDYILRAFLMYNEKFNMLFFNDFMGKFHSSLIHKKLPLILKNPGGSLWIRKNY